MAEKSSSLTRRSVMRAVVGAGVGSLVFQRALAAQIQANGRVDAESVQAAEWVAGLKLDEESREDIARSIARDMPHLQSLRALDLDNAVAPAFDFRCATAREVGDRGPANAHRYPLAEKRPASDRDLAFSTVLELAGFLRSRQVTSVELTELYLERLKRYDAKLLCVVTLCEQLAVEQAKRADAELEAGKDRGPLHGIPWGAKDLIAYPGYPTTWGAKPFEKQMREVKATVAERLDEAGAVLVAKLSLGALAMGDKWFGGMTRNPWNLEQGSSGSSAGSASAAVAGLVGFAIGSETHGSIVSPCSRCGASGLRPTFGRVSRAGCMALSWTMDKIGPIARSIGDCAVVFDIIRGVDGKDTTVVDRPFTWPPVRKLSDLRVGYFADMRESDEVAVLEKLGVKLVPITLPDKPAGRTMGLILEAEAAAAFAEFTRDGRTEGFNRWPGIFRRAHFTSAVDYIRANRVRSVLMAEMERALDGVDVYVDTRRRDLLMTNLTGHPTAVLPRRFAEAKDGSLSPRSITFTGRLFGESDLLTVALAWQQATGHHLRHPELAG